MNNEPYADVRDMYLAHSMFRREIGLAPDLVRGVASGDAERARIVADHLDLVDTVLRHHHHGEDLHLWPRLLTRGGPDAAAVVRVMEDQHEAIERANGEVRDRSATWRVTVDPEDGAALTDALRRLLDLLVEHLAVEEDQALPLIEKHITAAEWGQMVAEGGADLAPEHMALIFGMMAYEGDPETVRDIVAGMPPEIRPVIADLAAQAFARHAVRVYGTPAPPRTGARR
ncbi:hemerythrin domain-containing protein [Streptomyces sp. NPDC087420]|uniref:hemerythrin domain-containing protein n=1 Tax=Streptomyces sp. NPDC087420 TaxID=3365785 RepID=UPI003836DE61